jgi:uncharacterized membrane protein YfcA
VNPVAVAVGLVIGLAAGLVSGTLGVGGGVVMVPAMVLLLGIPESVAQGTSLFVILPIAISGVASHYRRHNLDFQPTIWMGLVGAVTAGAGAYLAVHGDDQRLRQVFAAYLVVVGLHTVYRGLRQPS